jgi:ABC-2 type transport system ATP-binding protein
MTTQAVLAAHKLDKVIEGRPILRALEFEVGAGQVIGLLGKNGAGKSTLIDTLLGFALPSSGETTVFGEPSSRMSPATKGRIGYVPQQDELMGVMTGSQLLSLVASFHERWDRDLVSRLIRAWSVPMDRRIAVLSGGERQKLATLAALGHRPDLLMMDEPASGLDPIARRQFMQAVLEVAADPGRTVFYSSHIVSDIERVASHVWILREGEIAWRGELDALKESVVRLQLRAQRDLPTSLALPGQLSATVSGRTAAITVGEWQPARREALERQFDCAIDVEPLGLEDIFLAVHA